MQILARATVTLLLAVFLAACGPREGDIYEDLLTGERFQVDRIGSCQVEYEAANGLATRVVGMPRPVVVGTVSSDPDPCFGVREARGDETFLVLRPVYWLSNDDRYRKLN